MNAPTVGKRKKRFNEYPSSIKNRNKRRLRYKRLPGEPYGQNYNSPRGKLAIRTMAEVARILGIHKSRVHQLEKHAFWKIRKKLGHELFNPSCDEEVGSISRSS
jgi:DNA-directed RNA polymerase sigma subunit (sigma70/sigma32)